MADRVECVVVGAGVVGLAVARALALAGREVLLLESEAQPGTITSARNSGVIHAGLYYAPGSFKARFCVAGNRALYRYATTAASSTATAESSSSRTAQRRSRCCCICWNARMRTTSTMSG